MSPEEAREAALHYLRRYAVTRWELARWLQRKGVARTTIHEVIRVLQQWGYIRDRWVLEQRIAAAQRKLWSRRRTYRDLRRRGIPARIARRAVHRWYPAETEWTVFQRWWVQHAKDPRARLRRRMRQAGFPSRYWHMITQRVPGDADQP